MFETGEVPAAFEAVIVNVGLEAEENPVKVIGDEDPVADWPVLAVIVYDVAAGELAGKEKATVTAPSLNGLPVPTFVTLSIIGLLGSKKLSCADDLIPLLLLAIYLTPIHYLYYALKSPASNQVLVATLVSVADEYVVLSFSPGVRRIVTPEASTKFAPVPDA